MSGPARRRAAAAVARHALLALLAGVGLLGAVACGEGPHYTLKVEVVTDDGKPVPDVPVRLGDGTRAVTDELGQVRRRITGDEGTRFRVDVDPPHGWVISGPPRTGVLLQHLVDGQGSGKPLPIEYQVTLAPRTRQYAVLVRVGVAGIPVETFGRRRGVTNRDGVAAFLYEGQPGEQLSVKLDTTAFPRLLPPSPTTTFQLGSKAQAFVVRERFTVVPEKPRPRIRRASGPRRL